MMRRWRMGNEIGKDGRRRRRRRKGIYTYRERDGRGSEGGRE
jgi:hypothetical protein